MEVQQTLNGARGVGGGGEGRYPGGLGGVATIMQAAGGWRPGVGGIVQRPYNKDHGFCVFWDYLTGLPKRSGSKVVGKVCRGQRSIWHLGCMAFRNYCLELSWAAMSGPGQREALHKRDVLLRNVSSQEPSFHVVVWILNLPPPSRI